MESLKISLVLCSSDNKLEVLEALNFELKRNRLLSLNRKKFMFSLLINPSTDKLTETSFSFLGYKIQKRKDGKNLFTILSRFISKIGEI